MMILDTNLVIKDSVQIITDQRARLPKDVKPDLESMVFLPHNDLLMMLGSGSSPIRNQAFFFNIHDKALTTARLDSFYSSLKELGLKDLNIEGACYVPGNIILSNRGHKANPVNHLVFTSPQIYEGSGTAAVSVIRIGGSNDTTSFEGVSGLTYAPKGDRLILTVSTEDTPNAIDDGKIGKSYLWIVKNITTKKNWKAINPDEVIDLESIDNRFKGHKIESACVIRETRHFLHLVLAADDDNGSSTLFKLVIEKN
jgi:hypothetical protein